jgi:D-inositol-3-phosphate glycosyltransferase
MKIAMVSEHASPLAALGGVDAGGQNVHVAALAAALARRGHHITVYTRREDPTIAERVSGAPGVEVVHVPAGPPTVLPKDELLPYMTRFGDWMATDWDQQGPPDVVHAHFWMSGLAALRACRAFPVPLVQTFHALGSVKRRHQGAADTSPADRIELERHLCRNVDLVLATCRDEVAELTALGARPTQVQVVPCGVDTDFFTPHPDDDEPAPVPDRLLAVGRLVPRKGYDRIVAALPLLPTAELVIAGGPPAERLAGDAYARELIALAHALGVGGRVRLTGAVERDAMPALFRSSAVVLTTPWYEPFGITALEAAACARPLVAASVGGLGDTVVDGVTGRLLTSTDPASIAAAVQPLLNAPGLARRWGTAARRRAVSTYEWTRVALQTERALEHLVSPAGHRSTSSTRSEAAWAR